MSFLRVDRPRVFAAGLVLVLGCTARASSGGGGFFDNGDSGTPSGDGPAAADRATLPDTPPSVDVAVTTDTPPGPPEDAVPATDVVGPTTPDSTVGPSCGDGTCGGGETCNACPQDCGPCPARCGDGTCADGETCSTCPQDCGTCPARCGDGTCNGTETCSTCAQDCGSCPTSCTATSCETCAASPSCGWCRSTGACGARSGSTCTDFVTAPGNCAMSVNITTSCTGSSTASSDCGFRLAQTYTCTPGSTVTLGCTGGFGDAGTCGFNGGTCSGDPVLRVCPGNTSTGCAYTGRIQPSNPGRGSAEADDDACGFCPWVRVTCPAAGSISVFTRAYDVSGARPASCTLARQ